MVTIHYSYLLQAASKIWFSIYEVFFVLPWIWAEVKHTEWGDGEDQVGVYTESHPGTYTVRKSDTSEYHIFIEEIQQQYTGQ